MQKIFYSLFFFAFLTLSSVITVSAQDNTTKKNDIDRFLKNQLKTNNIPGAAIGAVTNNNVVILKGYGYADKEHKKKITSQTPFFIGSLTKAFTAIAILQLVEQHKIKLTDPVIHYLPWFHLADKKSSNTITINDLLYQTSGLPMGAGEKLDLFVQADSKPQDMRRFVQGLANTELTAPVGKVFQYSNANYTILGTIIEQVTHTSYKTYIKDNIFTPLDMRHSFFSQKEARTFGLAQGFESVFMITIPTNRPDNTNILSAGYIISTAEDMTHFLLFNTQKGIYNGKRILSPTSMKLLQTPSQHSQGYALGWATATFDHDYILGHDGATLNYYASMALFPNKNAGTIILTNYNTILEQVVNPVGFSSYGVLRLLSGKSIPQSPPSIPTIYLMFFGFFLITLSLHVLFLVFMRKNISQIEAISPKRKIIYTLASIALLPITIPFALIFLFNIPYLLILFNRTADIGISTVILGISSIGALYYVGVYLSKMFILLYHHFSPAGKK